MVLTFTLQDTDKDVSYQYLTFFLEDDEELEAIREAYRSGKMLTGELKARCIAELQAYVKGFQDRRSAVTEEVVNEFMALRSLEWKANPSPTKPENAGKDLNEQGVELAADGSTKLTKNQEKKLAKQRLIDEKKAAAAAAKGSSS